MRYRVITVGLFVGLGLVASPSAAATITFADAVINPNEMFTVKIVVNDAVDLYSFTFDLAYDPSFLSSPKVEPGSVFGQREVPCDFCFSGGESSVGIVTGVADLLLGDEFGVSGSGLLLASISFQAGALGGDAGLRLLQVALSDSNFFPLDPTKVSDGKVTVDAGVPTPVPEPSTLALFGVGLAAMARKRLRRKSERSV